MAEFKHKHSLGQNFLKDKKVLANIIDSVDVKKEDLVIEVGPGHGALTKFLKLYKANLVCFEIDERLKNYLKIYEDEKTKIIFKDIMEVNLSNEIPFDNYDKVYVIANLPYYITTPIIEKFINSDLDIKAMVLMVQNEVAERLSAKPGSRDYGAITVLLNYYFDINKISFVSRKCFEPVPNVDSAVIKLEKINRKEKAIDLDLFRTIVRDSFAMKRKNIRNNLRKYNLEIIEDVLSTYGLDLSCRAEQVSVECFVDITNKISLVNSK
jgi:16S rRNA (adenine1518-N6/adenine1519-N6)-dimethyltransferase